MSQKIVIIGPAHPLRGGLATFDERLCRQFVNEGDHCDIFSFSLQYPSFLFPGTTQYSSEPAPSDITIYSQINSIHPFNWLHVGRLLKIMQPDIIIVRFWLPFMGPALGTIIRQIKKNKHTRIIALTDNVIPHEKRLGDRIFTKYFLRSCDAFITMSDKVLNDLRYFEPKKPAQCVRHPLYDNFGSIVPKELALEKLNLTSNKPIILFFGFIRKYKGLDLLLEALTILKQSSPQGLAFRLLIAGEFYEDASPYMKQIEEGNLQEDVLLHTHFIPDALVKYYVCASNAVIQPYRNATQSGVTPLAYHFEKPMIVTKVGSLADWVPEEKCGIVCEPTPTGIAKGIERYLKLGEAHFIPYIQKEKQPYTWDKLTHAFRDLATLVDSTNLS